MFFQYYEYVLAIAKYGNMSRAASELYISQPTLSRAISRLEENLGTTLIERSRNPLVLTPAGERYLHYTREMIDLKTKMLREFEALDPNRSEKLVIGFPFSYSSDFLSYVLPEFLAKHPNIKLEIKEMPGGLLEENLLNRTLDLAIIADTAFSSELHCEYLETQRILLVVPKNHPLYYPMEKNNYAILDGADIQKLHNEPFICYSPREGMHRVCETFFRSNRIQPKAILEVQDTSTAYSLAASGLGLTMISELRYYLRPSNVSENSFCCYQLGVPPYTRTRVIAYPKDIPLSRAAEDFIAISRREIHHLHPTNVSRAMNAD